MKWYDITNSDVVEFLESIKTNTPKYVLINDDSFWFLYDGYISDVHTELIAKGENLKKLLYNYKFHPYNYQEWEQSCQ